jgi:hypothetical protein
MNRRNFLGTVVGGVAASAAIRTWPFRVYSFPKDIHTFSYAPELSRKLRWNIDDPLLLEWIENKNYVWGVTATADDCFALIKDIQ